MALPIEVLISMGAAMVKATALEPSMAVVTTTLITVEGSTPLARWAVGMAQ